MALFRRRRPLHRRLAELGGLGDALDGPIGSSSADTTPPAAAPPGWHGEPRGEQGIHGVPRARRWDVVVTAEAPKLAGDAVRFVRLPDGALLAEGGEDDAALAPLAGAVDARLAPPYRAEAVRRAGEQWGVGASRIELATIPGLQGDEAELVATRDAHTLRVDRRPSFGSAPVLERLGEREGVEYVVRARRLRSDLWEVETSPL